MLFIKILVLLLSASDMANVTVAYQRGDWTNVKNGSVVDAKKILLERVTDSEKQIIRSIHTVYTKENVLISSSEHRIEKENGTWVRKSLGKDGSTLPIQGSWPFSTYQASVNQGKFKSFLEYADLGKTTEISHRIFDEKGSLNFNMKTKLEDISKEEYEKTLNSLKPLKK